MHRYFVGSSGDLLFLYNMVKVVSANYIGTCSSSQILLARCANSCLHTGIYFHWDCVRSTCFTDVDSFYVCIDFLIGEFVLVLCE